MVKLTIFQDVPIEQKRFQTFNSLSIFQNMHLKLKHTHTQPHLIIFSGKQGCTKGID